ncbi:S-adenosyl-L-methionine-dependentmethyltransferases superfamily protein [Striga asiatica]|uniref:S-adenosyl-L-methionine-dependentmethyltransferases superfamily protein n=1 Tax=Striga asiatica TaxID=4170 RepID=A0A5A7RJ78_STRAF|nr:S-adenosyl-L-methionine-dependentmethyltransferases superfamily protein [Striga asiatica]
MANLFIKQAEQYSVGRPSYPNQLFDFIATKTPSHDLAWDVGTGSGQAARSLANIYKNVIATDTSPKQLEYAAKLPNITYKHTSPCMTISELQEKIGPKSSVDLVTIAQAMHWFDLPKFYQQVKWALKKPDGVIAAWCYTSPEVNPGVDSVLKRYCTNCVTPHWAPARRFVAEKYETIEFPFGPVDGLENNGPFRFNSEEVMDLERYLTYLKSWSPYQTAKEKGVELLSDDVIEGFTRAWNEDGKIEKVVTFPVYLRIGKVGS